MQIIRRPAQSKGTDNQVQITDNSGGFLASILKQIGGVLGVGSTKSSAILNLESTDKGFLKPVMDTSQQNTISTPEDGLEVYNTDTKAPMYNHPTDDFVPVGRYAGNAYDVAGSKNGQVMASNLDGELIPIRMIGSGTTIFPASSTGNYANNSVNLGASNYNFLYGYFNRTYANQFYVGGTALGIITASSGTGAGMRFTSGSGQNYFKVHGETVYKGISVRDTDISTSHRIEATAVMELQSTTRGFLPPRMTTAEMGAIANTEGLIIHNNDADRPYYNNGNSWRGFGDLYGFYVLLASTTPILGTTQQSMLPSLASDFQGSLTIPANTFKVGDSFHLTMAGELPTSNTNDTFTFTVINGGVTLGEISVDLEDLTAGEEMFWEAEVDFTIRTIGATGTLCTNIDWTYNKKTLKDFRGTRSVSIESIDTTVASTLEVKGQFAGYNGSTIYTSYATLRKTYCSTT